MTCVSLQTTQDLEVVDKRRRNDFKEYEMEKEFEYQEKLRDLPDDRRQQEQQQHQDLQKKHKQHEKINHPVSPPRPPLWLLAFGC